LSGEEKKRKKLHFGKFGTVPVNAPLSMSDYPPNIYMDSIAT